MTYCIHDEFHFTLNNSDYNQYPSYLIINQ